MLTYASICDGIGAVHLAWKPLGLRPLWCSEIAPFPSAVTHLRHPEIPNYGDLLTLTQRQDLGRPDVLVGGTPCQSFSIAGLRAGLADPRGNLALAFVALVDALRPRWVVWENVPGVLSVDGGRAFGSFLGGLGELGYGWAYRVMDAQYVGLAQRRKRVFVVASPGDWRRSAAVLFEPESLRWDSPPRRETGAGVAGAVGTGASCGGGWRVGADKAAAGQVVPVDLQNTRIGGDVVGTLDTTRPGRGGGQAVISLQDVRPRDKAQNGRGWNADGTAYTVDAANTQGVLAYGGGNTSGPIDVATACLAHPQRQDFDVETFIAHTLRGTGHDASEDGTGRGVPLVPVLGASGVRRLMPHELERLQGFPDHFTRIPYRRKGEDCPDGPRAKALGNSMAVPVMAWIGRRLLLVDATPAP